MKPHMTIAAVGALRRSATNPRPSDDPLDDILPSIREKGVLQALLVRPHPDEEGALEIVCGERRWRAAQVAKLAAVPVVVREMTAKEVAEAQLIENLARRDLPPVEEAKAYARLRDQHGHDVVAIAAEVGRSVGYVLRRLALLNLSAKAIKALEEGKISTAVAELIGRIPSPKLQNEAAEHLGRPDFHGDLVPPGEAREHIQRHYMLRLGEAQFDITDAALLAGAPACTSCPHRTGNQPALFADVEGDDTCTNPPCYEKKADAAWKLRAKAHKAEGRKVLTQAESKSVLTSYGSLSHQGAGRDYVQLDSKNYEDPKSRSWKRLLGKDAADKVVLARDERGRVHELVPAAEARAIAKARNPELRAKKGEGKVVSTATAEERKRKAAVKARRAAGPAAIAEIVAEVERAGVVEVAAKADYWRIVLGKLLNGYGQTLKSVLKRREIEVPNGSWAGDVMRAELGRMNEVELAALLLEVVCSDSLYDGWNTEADATLRSAAELFGVDYAGRLEEATAAAKPKPKGGGRRGS